MENIPTMNTPITDHVRVRGGYMNFKKNMKVAPEPIPN
jgi:hypothetical protein